MPFQLLTPLLFSFFLASPLFSGEEASTVHQDAHIPDEETQNLEEFIGFSKEIQKELVDKTGAVLESIRKKQLSMLHKANADDTKNTANNPTELAHILTELEDLRSFTSERKKKLDDHVATSSVTIGKFRDWYRYHTAGNSVFLAQKGLFDRFLANDVYPLQRASIESQLRQCTPTLSYPLLTHPLKTTLEEGRKLTTLNNSQYILFVAIGGTLWWLGHNTDIPYMPFI